MMYVSRIGSIAAVVLLAAGIGCKAGSQDQKEPAGSPPPKGEPAKAPAAKVEAPKDILTPAFGEKFGGLLKSAEKLKLIPAGWTVASASVEAQGVSIKMAGPAGATAAIDFVHKDAGKGAAGKWFAIVAPAEPAGFMTWAKALDGKFEKSPWTTVADSKVVNEGPKKEPTDTSNPPPGPDDKINATPPAPGNTANVPKPPPGPDDKINATPPAPGNMANVPKPPPGQDAVPEDKPAEAKPAQ